MITIIVGPDGSGKSTLAKALSKASGHPIRHIDKPKNEEEREEMYAMYRNEILTNDNVIYDRFAHCEIAYGPIMRGASALTLKQLYNLERMLLEKGAIIIYCNADIHTLWSRLKERGETFIREKQTLLDIQRRYETLMKIKPHYIPVLEYEVHAASMS